MPPPRPHHRAAQHRDAAACCRRASRCGIGDLLLMLMLLGTWIKLFETLLGSAELLGERLVAVGPPDCHAMAAHVSGLSAVCHIRDASRRACSMNQQAFRPDVRRVLFAQGRRTGVPTGRPCQRRPARSPGRCPRRTRPIGGRSTACSPARRRRCTTSTRRWCFGSMLILDTVVIALQRHNYHDIAYKFWGKTPEATLFKVLLDSAGNRDSQNILYTRSWT